MTLKSFRVLLAVMVTSWRPPLATAAVSSLSQQEMGIFFLQTQSDGVRERMLASRFAEWVENQEDLGLTSERKPRFLSQAVLKSFVAAAQLRRTLDEVEKSPSALASADVSAWKGLIEKAESLVDTGPLVQRTYWALARAHWIRGESKPALQAFSDGITMFTADEAREFLASLELEEDNKAFSDLRVLWGRSGDAPRFDCQVSVDSGAGRFLWINGLAQKKAHGVFSLTSRKAHRFAFELRGKGIVSTQVTCRGPGKHVLAAEGVRSLKDRAEVLPEGPSLFIDARNQGIGVYIFSPFYGMERVDVKGELTGNTPSFAIDQDKFRELYKKHRDSGRLAWNAQEALAVEPLPSSTAERTEGAWYNNPVVWFVAAAVVGGSVAAILSTRGNRVESQGPSRSGIGFK